MNIQLGIIGGTGLTSLQGLEITKCEKSITPYGEPSAELVTGEFFGQPIVFLARHGTEHHIPPHEINYRANIWSLKNAGVTHVIAINAVGGIKSKLRPGTLVIPDQLIDYTWGRRHTLFDGENDKVQHIDFTHPYCSYLRQNLIDANKISGLDIVDGGTYAVMQGPRLETAAEINRLEKDGCDIVGMTGMPEAALAKEMELNYACIAPVVNPAAGRGEGEITMLEIEKHIVKGIKNVRLLLEQVLPIILMERSPG